LLLIEYADAMTFYYEAMQKGTGQERLLRSAIERLQLAFSCSRPSLLLNYAKTQLALLRYCKPEEALAHMNTVEGVSAKILCLRNADSSVKSNALLLTAQLNYKKYKYHFLSTATVEEKQVQLILTEDQCKRALEIDPNLSEAKVTLAKTMFLRSLIETQIHESKKILNEAEEHLQTVQTEKAKKLPLTRILTKIRDRSATFRV